MICEIITIGTEVVMGNTANTNSLFLSQKLTELGIEVYFHTSVDDNEERLASVIKIALSRSNLIITTGGLGPTKDDMTKEIISKAIGLNMDFDKSMENSIKDMFINGNSIMTDNNKKQALKPAGSKFIENKIGTAPGIFIEKENKKIILLPGPPMEMELMFNTSVIDLIKEDLNIISTSIDLVGIGESSLETRLNELKLNTNNTSILTFAKRGTIEIRIISKHLNKNIIENEIADIKSRLQDEFKDYIYGYDNVSLEKVVVDLLINKNLTLALCESITGGMIASSITTVPGSSKVLDRSIVTYSNISKMKEVGVKETTLNKYGPVSRETAYEMAKGLYEKSNVDIALSITGLAGPGGATLDKTIGLVYIGIITEKTEKIYKYTFNGDRNLIRIRATIKALDEIRRLLK